MKKIIFSGYLANDKDCFVEIALCSYECKKDGEKVSMPYVSLFEISKSFPKGFLTDARNAKDMVKYVDVQQMCKSDVEKLIKGINKYPFEAIAVFGTEPENHLCERLREVAYEDDYFDDLPEMLKK
ncbi:MAG: hypothetical protein J6T10_19105 [Methanobrevibacter sp.]|nr:hypothetical protein [Methanobrevibacter sp.]